MEDLRTELLAAFKAELADHLAALRGMLGDAEAGRAADLRDASRRAHSLKGAARAVEQPATEGLAHQAETLLLAAEDSGALEPAAVAELRRLLDEIEDSANPRTVDQTPAEVPGGAAYDRIRVSGAHVEQLAQALHGLGTQIQGQSGLGGEIDAFRAELVLLEAAAEREGNSDLGRRLGRLTRQVERLRRDQVRLQVELDRTLGTLEQSTERILLLPVETLFDGYERMVREIAASQGKAAVLRVDAVEAEADRRVLQALREPMLHVLRNAISHGIEDPAARRAGGKPDQGEVWIACSTERGRLRLTVSDDGRGLDYRRIEARARATGLISEDAPTPGPDTLHSVLFQQGFSTASQIDALSGRGIGLSVVAEAVRRLHGSLSIEPSSLGGTRVEISVPLALARQTLLLVEAGGASYGLPASAVAQVLRVAPEQLDRVEGRQVLVVGGEPVPVASLAELLGEPAAPFERPHYSALLLRAGEKRLVVVVDELQDVRSTVVGDPTAIAADVPLVYGTLLLEGGVVLVLSPEALIAEALGRSGALRLAAALPDRQERRRTVLVVDDSITTRTLEKSILEAQGYSVVVSVDGLAALERLRSGLDTIDLVVADVEMPRMDGFALLTAIRNDPTLSALPVVMMTSRNSPEDIERGLDLGANAYVTKQEFDQGALISVVRQLV
jgi:two-component system, chemotaxis family, sensor kinase CheA